MSAPRELVEAVSQAFAEDDRPAMIRLGDQLLARDPTDLQGLYAAGVAMLREERHGLAAVLLNAASQIAPNKGEIWNNLGVAFQEWRPAIALQCFEKALEVSPAMQEPLHNLVSVLSSLGRWGEAIGLGEELLAKVGPDVDVSHNLALAYMQTGEWSKAWPNWAACIGHKRGARFAELPGIWRWEGAVFQRAEHIGQIVRVPDGETAEAVREFDDVVDLEAPPKVVIYGEQGLGDEILFAGLVDQAVNTGAEIILECEPRLEGLFRRSFPQVQVYGTLLDAEPYWLDIEAPSYKLESMGLGEYFAPVPYRRAPYLRADPQLRAMFRAWLDALGPGVKVGLSWSGGFAPADRAQRTIPIEALGPIVNSPGCQFICLEYDQPSELPPNTFDIRWAVAKGVDYDLTAALIAELDVVVSVPQTVVDAAGALGTPCLALVPPIPNWRFSEAAGDEAWGYQGVEIYRRQGQFWTGAIARAAMRLRQLAQLTPPKGLRADARKAAE